MDTATSQALAQQARNLDDVSRASTNVLAEILIHLRRTEDLTAAEAAQMLERARTRQLPGMKPLGIPGLAVIQTLKDRLRDEVGDV